MTVVYKVREEKRKAIPAVTHIDGTARVQTVGQHDHPRYYQLIKKFKELTGVPVVVNTSFNVMGEPIVCAPEHAIRCFYGTGIDRLVIGNYIITKNPTRS
jgi:carbamoyltransferase